MDECVWCGWMSVSMCVFLPLFWEVFWCCGVQIDFVQINVSVYPTNFLVMNVVDRVADLSSACCLAGLPAGWPTLQCESPSLVGDGCTGSDVIPFRRVDYNRSGLPDTYCSSSSHVLHLSVSTLDDIHILKPTYKSCTVMVVISWLTHCRGPPPPAEENCIKQVVLSARIPVALVCTVLY